MASKDQMPNLNGNEILSTNSNVNRPDLSAAYQSLLDANPYMNLDYKQSGWQKFLSNLGFRTGYDKRVEDLQLQANEWNANVANMAFQNEYNSPAAQSARMRVAGQNPDLLGTGDVAESSSMPEDTNPPAPTETDAQSVSQFANVIMSAFSMATGFAKDLGTLKSLHLANDNQEIANVSGLITGAQNFLLHHTPSSMPTSDAEWADAFMNASNVLEAGYRPHMSKRAYRRFSNAVSGLWDSLPREADAYKLYLDNIRNKQDAHILHQSEYYDDQEEVLRELVDPLVKLNDRYIKAQSKADAVGAENVATSEEQSQLQGLPEAVVGSEVAGFRQTQQEFNMQRELRSTLSEIIHKLKAKADSGKRGSGLADTTLLVLSIMSMMNFSSSSQSGYDAKRGDWKTSSRSIGF